MDFTKKVLNFVRKSSKLPVLLAILLVNLTVTSVSYAESISPAAPLNDAFYLTPEDFKNSAAHDNRQFGASLDGPADEMDLLAAHFDLFKSEMRLTISDERHLPTLRHHGKKTEYSALLLHGLYGSPHHMKLIQDQLFKMGINTVSWLLPGHYQSDMTALDRVTGADWIQSSRAGLKWAQNVGEKVIVVGFSTGGIINTMFASEAKNKIVGLMLMAPAFKVHGLSFLAAQLGDLAGIVGNDLAFGPPNGKNISYYSPKAALELEKMADGFRAQYPTFRHLALPTLQMGFNNDFTVDGNKLQELAAQAPGIVHNLRIPIGSKSPTWIFSTFDPPVEFAMSKIRLNHGIFPGADWATPWPDTMSGKKITITQAVADWFKRVQQYAR